MHPTAQYGQTPGWTFASLIRSVVAAADTGARSSDAVPTAAAALAEPAYLKNSRRDKLMASPRREDSSVQLASKTYAHGELGVVRGACGQKAPGLSWRAFAAMLWSD